MEIGERVVYLRMQQGVTQTALADKAGLRQSQMSRFERGKLNPSTKNLVKIADALGCPTEILLSPSIGITELDAFSRGRPAFSPEKSIRLISSRSLEDEGALDGEDGDRMTWESRYGHSVGILWGEKAGLGAAVHGSILVVEPDTRPMRGDLVIAKNPLRVIRWKPGIRGAIFIRSIIIRDTRAL